VATSAGSDFDAVFVDFQDSPKPPVDYVGPAFWRQVRRVLRPGGQVIVNVANSLRDGPDWPACLDAIGAADLISVPLDEVYDTGNFLMIATGAPWAGAATGEHGWPGRPIPSS
jgi:predicted membrane-bound spermidine synthase